MPPKTYKIKDKLTGKSFTVDWAGPNSPTQEDIDNVRRQQEKPKPILHGNEAKKFQPETPRLTLPFIGETSLPGFPPSVGKAAFALSDYLAPEPMPQEEVEKLPLTSRIGRLGREFASGITSPEVLATAPLMATGAGAVAVPAYYALQMAKQVPQAVGEFAEAPSLETGVRLGATSLGAVGAGRGAYKRFTHPVVGYEGLKGFTGKVTPPSEVPIEAPIEAPIPLERPIQQQLLTPDVLRLKRPTPPLVKLPRQPKIIEPTEVPLPEQAGLEFPSAYQEPAQLIEGPPESFIRRGVQPWPTPSTDFPITSPVEIPPVPRAIEAGMVDESLTKDIRPFRTVDRRRLAPELGEPIPRKPARFIAPPEGKPIDIRPEVELPAPRFNLERPVERPPIVEQPQLTGRVVKQSTVERIKRRMKEQERPPERVVERERPIEPKVEVSEVEPTKKSSVLEQLKQRKLVGEQKTQPLERRVETGKRTNFDAWLQEKKNITHEQLMKLSKDEQMDIRGDYATDSSWQFGLTTTTKKPSMLEGLKKREKIEPTELSDQAKFYEENIETIQSGKPSSVNVRVVVRAGIRAGKEADEIIGDLMTRKFSSEVATKIVEREAAKLKGESGFAGKEPSFVTHAREIIDKTRKQTTSPEAKKVLDDPILRDFFDKWTKGPEFVVGKMGKYGEELKTVLDRVLKEMSAVPGEYKDLLDISKTIKLSKEEVANIHAVRTQKAKPMNEAVIEANKKLTNVAREMGREATKLGMKEKTISGREVGFHEFDPETYWPRYATKEAALKREHIIDVIMREKKVNRTEAKEILENPKSPYYSRSQHQRLLPEEKAEYNIDIESWMRHIEDLGKEIGIARELGPGNIYSKKLHSLIEKIREEKGSVTANEAEEIVKNFIRPKYDRSLQVDRPVSNFLSAVAVARYLPNFIITNMPNSLLVFQESTIKGFQRGTAKYWTNIETAHRNSLRGGSLEQLSKIEYAPGQDIVSKTVGKGIDFSEKNMRAWSNEVGRETALDLFEQLKSGKLNSKIAKGRLKEFLLENPDNVLKQTSLTETQLRTAGFQMVKNTQGIVSPLSIPKGWQNKGFVIDQMLMFKRYSGIQLGNTIRSVKRNPAKAAVVLPVMTTVLGQLASRALAVWKGTVAGVITDDTVINAIDRELNEERGKYYAQIAKRFGVDDENAKFIGEITDTVNRGFVIGILGDLFVDLASGPTRLTTGLMPGIDITTELVNDVLKLSSAMSEDIDIG